MADIDVKLDRGQGPGQGCIGVAVDKHKIRPFIKKDFFDLSQHQAHLFAVVDTAVRVFKNLFARSFFHHAIAQELACFDIVFRGFEFKLLKKDLIHLIGEMLPRVDDEIIDPP